MTERILNGIEVHKRVYIDVRDLAELLRAADEPKRADELVEWERKWRETYDAPSRRPSRRPIRLRQ